MAMSIVIKRTQRDMVVTSSSRFHRYNRIEAMGAEPVIATIGLPFTSFRSCQMAFTCPGRIKKDLETFAAANDRP
jgi:hypothetical protein